MVLIAGEGPEEDLGTWSRAAAAVANRVWGLGVGRGRRPRGGLVAVGPCVGLTACLVL